MGRNWRPKKDVVCPQCGWRGRRVSTAKSCPQCGHWHPVECRPERRHFTITITTGDRTYMCLVRAMTVSWERVVLPAIKRLARDYNRGKPVSWEDISISDHSGHGSGPMGEYTDEDWNRDLDSEALTRSFAFVTIDRAGFYKFNYGGEPLASSDNMDRLSS